MHSEIRDTTIRAQLQLDFVEHLWRRAGALFDLLFVNF
jgi:hypothetical protein